MEKKNEAYAKNILKKCVICGKPTMLDQFGNGRCEHCKWYHNKEDGHFPEAVNFPNMVSFARAKQLVQEGKPFIPTFEDFINGFKVYGEMELYHKGHKYGLARNQDDFIVFHAWEDFENGQNFQTIGEFHATANINGKLLKDIWAEIESPNYTQE